jgi:hypothetical protein
LWCHKNYIMKTKLHILFLVLTLYACHKEICVPIESLETPCVEKEPITAKDTGFLFYNLWNPAINGFAKGVKINKELKMSALMGVSDNTFGIQIVSFDTVVNGNGRYLASDRILIHNIPIFPNVCLPLNFLKEKTLPNDSIKMQSIYSMDDDDITIFRYELDTTADNRLEIIEFNKDKKQFKGRFKATYTTKKPYLPYYPGKVRFFNMDIEIGY